MNKTKLYRSLIFFAKEGLPSLLMRRPQKVKCNEDSQPVSDMAHGRLCGLARRTKMFLLDVRRQPGYLKSLYCRKRLGRNSIKVASQPIPNLFYVHIAWIYKRPKDISTHHENPTNLGCMAAQAGLFGSYSSFWASGRRAHRSCKTSNGSSIERVCDAEIEVMRVLHNLFRISRQLLAQAA